MLAFLFALLTFAHADYYQTLGVARDANEAEIKAAYKFLAKKLHPDLNPGKGDAAFKALGQAYDILKNPSTRWAYDSTLPRQTREPKVEQPSAREIHAPDDDEIATKFANSLYRDVVKATNEALAQPQRDETERQIRLKVFFQYFFNEYGEPLKAEEVWKRYSADDPPAPKYLNNRFEHAMYSIRSPLIPGQNQFALNDDLGNSDYVFGIAWMIRRILVNDESHRIPFVYDALKVAPMVFKFPEIGLWFILREIDDLTDRPFKMKLGKVGWELARQTDEALKKDLRWEPYQFFDNFKSQLDAEVFPTSLGNCASLLTQTYRRWKE